MHTNRLTRVRATALAGTITIATLGVVLSTALSLPAAAATPTLPQTSAAQSAAAWLGEQFTPGGFIPGSSPGTADLSSTVNSILALASTGVDASTARAGLTYLEAHSASFISAEGSDGPGQLSLLILDAHALAADQTNFGGTDLVARLLATEQPSGSNAGRFGTDAQVPDFDSGPYDQGLALAALKAAGVTANSNAISWEQNAQCPNGGWTAPDSVSNPCTGDPTKFMGPDTNTTAVAVEGLAAQNGLTSPVSTNALGFLEAAEDPDAGWGYEPNPTHASGNSDPDSTSLVIQALLAMGQSPTSGTFTKGGATPVTSLLGYVVTSGSDTGAISSPFGSPTVGNLLATYQTVPALAGLTFPISPPRGPYSPLTPVRICDTRAGNPSGLNGAAAQCNGPGNAGSTIAAGGTRIVNVAGAFNVPTDATAVVLNITVVNPTASGYLTVYPPGAAQPFTANVNYSGGEVVPNLVEVGTGSSGDVSVFSKATTDIVVDLEGFVAPTAPGPSGSGLYNPLAPPARLCDTRAGNPSDLSGGDAQCNGTANAGERLGAGGTLSVQVATNNGIPAGATAAVLNVTAVAPSGAGFLTVYPKGAARPVTANVNYTAGQTTGNRVIVPLSPTGTKAGEVSIYSKAASDVVVDISGYFSAPGGSGTAFTAADNPVRICDTRAGNPSGLSGSYDQCDAKTLGPARTMTVNVAGLAGVPANAKAVVVNLTGVSPSVGTFLTVFPGLRRPLVSDLNLSAGDIKANLTVATLSSHGTVSIYNNTGSTDVVLDVLGWYS